MLITKNTVVSLAIELADISGKVIESSEQPLAYLHGGYDNIFPVVEAALEGKQAGAKLKLRLEPEEAFGDYDEELLRIEERARFPEVLEVGMQFEGVPGEEDDDLIYTVTDIADDRVVLDGNHPLAGIALDFSCTVLGVRAASEDEIEHGHAHETDDGIIKVATH